VIYRYHHVCQVIRNTPLKLVGVVFKTTREPIVLTDASESRFPLLHTHAHTLHPPEAALVLSFSTLLFNVLTNKKRDKKKNQNTT
jgi:hypothetical protein